jgi:hypothetical protein
MDPTHEDSSPVDNWQIYAYVRTKLSIFANLFMDFFPAFLDSPPWVIFLTLVLVVAPIVWFLIKLIQWITSTDNTVTAVKVCLSN